MSTLLIKNAIIVNEGKQLAGGLLIKDQRISKIFPSPQPSNVKADEILDAEGKYLIPGVIDDQVHFRQPGLTHKGDIASESKAAAAGGVTSFMEMPNTIPQSISIDELEKKFTLAESSSWVNYSFYLGATNDNLDQIRRVNPKTVCGIKIFMGSSTGNMLVDNLDSLKGIFAESPVLVATHCEDEATIRSNAQRIKNLYGDTPPVEVHPLIRDEEACYRSSSLAVELADRYGTRLHILHISTEKELGLFHSSIPLEAKKITAEVCVHHLWFEEEDYSRLGTLIKWNPSIKKRSDKLALLEGLKIGLIDVIATDHAPHTLEEKNAPYFNSPSGGPMVQHSLAAMLELCSRGTYSVEQVVEFMCHAPAKLFRVKERGYIREGYFADLALVDRESHWFVEPGNILYKCRWSPLLNERFQHRVTHTFVNGNLVYQLSPGNNTLFYQQGLGMRLLFDR